MTAHCGRLEERFCTPDSFAGMCLANNDSKNALDLHDLSSRLEDFIFETAA
jgi:hypothetical protein